MTWLLLIALIGVFVALHVLPFRTEARGRLTAVLGAGGYKAAYTLLSLVGLFGAFAVAGMAPVVVLWTATDALRWAALVLTALGFVLLGAAYGPGDGSRLARHPMLAGMGLWALAHALTSGNLAHLVVFGTLAAYTVAAMVASDSRDARLDPERFADRAAGSALVPFVTLATGSRAGLRWQGPAAGLGAWVVFLSVHAWLFGASPFPTALG